MARSKNTIAVSTPAFCAMTSTNEALSKASSTSMMSWSITTRLKLSTRLSSP